MPLRPINLPVDLEPLAEVTPLCFKYPENDDWSVQSDEAESLLDSIKSIKRLWPLIQVGQFVSPAMRDIFQGCIWEEEGKMVGTILVQRRGTTDKWSIGNVGVLPDYRRRGIARKLMEGGLDLIRSRGGKKAILDVIDGNTPAISLYESLGFEPYSGSAELHLMPDSAPAEPSLPDGYRMSPIHQFDWQPRYEMDQRVSPEMLLKFEPPEIGRYKPPFFIRLLVPLINAAQKLIEKDFGIYKEDILVARGGFSVTTKDKGISAIRMRVDPAHPALAGFFARYLLRHILTLDPNKRIEASIPGWQVPALEALMEVGFKKRMSYKRMGIEL